MNKKPVLVHLDPDQLDELDAIVKQSVSLNSRSHAIRVAIADLLRKVASTPPL